MKPYYQDNMRTLYHGDARDMTELADESVQCVVTSPPYWGLRMYSGVPDLIWGGDAECRHEWGGTTTPGRKTTVPSETVHKAGFPNAFRSSPRYVDHIADESSASGAFCSLCGAWRGSYGLEPTPELYVDHTIEILREVWRVLRKDGVVFLNIGDSYATSGASGPQGKTSWRQGRANVDAQCEVDIPLTAGLKPKDLVLIPFRVALAAQADGWWVRSDIIWAKPNPMPESVRDRPTTSHEHILMLTKSPTYYWDADAVREPQDSADRSQFYTPENRPTQEQIAQKISRFAKSRERDTDGRFTDQGKEATNPRDGYQGQLRNARPPRLLNPAGRNIRSVWTFPTQPYPEAHFATFPGKLPETCIKAATPEVGCCSECGAPWERVVDVKGGTIGHSWHAHENDEMQGQRVADKSAKGGRGYTRETTGWQPTCGCGADKVPSVVLDPFAGSGTTLLVAAKLGRRSVGYDLSAEYCHLAVQRNRQPVLGI